MTSELRSLELELRQIGNALPSRIDVIPESVEQGLALMTLEEKVHELAAQFGLRPADLNQPRSSGRPAVNCR